MQQVHWEVKWLTIRILFHDGEKKQKDLKKKYKSASECTCFSEYL